MHGNQHRAGCHRLLQSGKLAVQTAPPGCYDLALGHEESACAWLIQAFEMEPNYYEDALKDPDFKSILNRNSEMKKEEEEDEFLT